MQLGSVNKNKEILIEQMAIQAVAIMDEANKLTNESEKSMDDAATYTNQRYDTLYEELSKLMASENSKEKFYSYMDSFERETLDTLSQKQSITDNKILTIENKMTNLSLSSLIATDVKNAADSVKKLCTAVKDKIDTFFHHLKDSVIKTCNEIKTEFSNMYQESKDFVKDVKTQSSEGLSEFYTTCDKKIDDAVGKIDTATSNAVNKVENSIISAKDFVLNKIQTAKSEISQMVIDYKTNKAMEQLAAMDAYQAELAEQRKAFIDQCSKNGLNVTKNQKEIDLIDISNNQITTENPIIDIEIDK